jgi:hypothetical protein
MDGFLKMSARERRLACLQVEEQMRLQAASVEKTTNTRQTFVKRRCTIPFDHLEYRNVQMFFRRGRISDNPPTEKR